VASGRPPDAADEFVTDPRAALLYRLTGDTNPLHVDPAMAAMGGFDRPILHGLATLGIACRMLLRRFAGGDATRLRRIRARFTRHVFPGDTLRVEYWQCGGGGEDVVCFRVRVRRGRSGASGAPVAVEEDDVVLAGGVAHVSRGEAGQRARL